MAEALGQTGITEKFAEASASLTTGWKWWLALASLLLIYFYAHYVFASITAHVTAMYIPFLIVILAAGAPPYLAVLSLAYFSNLGAALTHYGTTPAPIYFGAGYTTQRTWWWLGLITSLVTITDLESGWLYMVESSRTLVRLAGAPCSCCSCTDKTMAGYSSTPLAKKLGIKEGSRVALVNAPKDFQSELGELPDDVKFVKPSTKSLDIILFFVLSECVLARDFAKLAKSSLRTA